MNMRWSLLLTAALVICAVLPLQASAKGKPPKPQDPPPSGTVYYTYESATWAMAADGSGKTALPVGVGGQPSHDLHGGHRWWLQARNTADGWQLFAVRGDGDEGATVRLTTDASMEVRDENGGQPATFRWAKDDATVSWVGRKRVGGAVVDPGIYAAGIVFDAAGDVVGLSQQPQAPLIALEALALPDDLPDGGAHDWAPDGAHLVYARWTRDASQPAQVRVADLVAGTSSLLATPAASPRWSPDGQKIAYVSTGFPEGIATIQPDGSEATVILQAKGGRRGFWVTAPRWAPTSQHLVYHKTPQAFPGSNDERDVWRATDTGKDKANLTDDLDDTAQPVAWR